MKKGKAITILSAICVVLAFVLVMSFIKFSSGIYDYNSVIGAIKRGFDFDGGATYTLRLSDENVNEVEDIDDVLKTLAFRLESIGFSQYEVTALKQIEEGVSEDNLDYDIRISVPQDDNYATKVNYVTTFGEITLCGGTSANPTEEILEGYKIFADAQYAGETTNSSYQTVYAVSVTFDGSAYNEIQKLIKAADKDGNSYYVSAKLGDETIIDGSSAISEYLQDRSFGLTTQSEDNAKLLAFQLKTGGLDYEYEFIDDEGDVISYSQTRTISSIVDGSAYLMSIIVIVDLVVLLSVFFFEKFHKFGYVAMLTLIAGALAETAMMVAVPGIVLSLAGFIGMIATLILIADGLFITAKRIDEEKKNGKTVKASIKSGFRRSLFPTMHISVFAGIVGLVLFALMKGQIKCFGITFGIGAVIAFLAIVLLARLLTAVVLPLVKNQEKFINKAEK